MGFPKAVADSVLVKCQRCCCICHKFCGTHIELHHIIQEADGGENTEENCIPLCHDCHTDVGSYNPHHPRGRKYSLEELKMHRNNWYDIVSNNHITICDTNYERYRTLDINLYNRIKDLFNDDVRFFLSEFNFAGFSYYDKYINPLYEFNFLCKKPDFKFINQDLEIIRIQLFDSTVEFISFLAVNTFPNALGNNTVPPEWEIEQPERFKAVVEELNSKSTAVWELFCNLVNSARKILAV